MNRLRELRVSKGWKQADLAAAINAKPQTVSRYERGDRDIDSSTIRRLCEIFGCSADYLLGLSDLPTAELSEEEQGLVLAFRRADARARELVRLALEPFMKEESSETAG